MTRLDTSMKEALMIGGSAHCRSIYAKSYIVRCLKLSIPKEIDAKNRGIYQYWLLKQNAGKEDPTQRKSHTAQYNRLEPIKSRDDGWLTLRTSLSVGNPGL